MTLVVLNFKTYKESTGKEALRLANVCKEVSEEFSVKIASTIEEFSSFIESGFEYISDYNDKKVLRKRK